MARMKAIVRRYYNKFAVEYTKRQLDEGVSPDKIKVPSKAQGNKSRLAEWWGRAAEEVNTDLAFGTHMFDKVKDLARVCTDNSLYEEAVLKKAELFPNWQLRRR